MLKVRNWLILSSGWVFSFSIGAALAVDPSAPVGDFGSDSVHPFHPILASPSKPGERFVQRPAPAELAGRWNVFKTIQKPHQDVTSARSEDDADIRPRKGGAEWTFVSNRSTDWTVTQEEQVACPLIVDKVEGKTMFARFQRSHERHALVLSLVNENRFKGLERIILVDKDGKALQEGKQAFSLVGRRIGIEDDEATKSP